MVIPRLPKIVTMASKKRGLSLEEKRQRMLEIFYTKKEFFLLKELEKIAPKEKGITSQSVKDVLQSLGKFYATPTRYFVGHNARLAAVS